MCNAMVLDGSHSWRHEKKRHSWSHECAFKIVKCSHKRLCILCFLLCHLAAGNCAEGQNSTQSPRNETTTHNPEVAIETAEDKVECPGETCYLKISSTEVALKKMAAVSEHIFDSYVSSESSQKLMYEEQFEQFVNDLGLLKDDHKGHHHGPSIFEDEEFLAELYDYDYYAEENETESRKRRSAENFACISSVPDFLEAYFDNQKSSQKVSLTLYDLMTVMPQLLLDLKRPECTKAAEHDHGHGHGRSKVAIEHSTTNIWLISMASVLIISFVSLLGVLVIPLLRHSNILNNIISFLVSLAVGTLAGDALLHLLPHASGLHDHSHDGHDHGGHNHGHGHGEEEKDHFDSMWKGLVTCAGIYIFYLLEIGMGYVRNRKDNKKGVHCAGDTATSSSPSKQGLKETQGGTAVSSPSESPLLVIAKAMSAHSPGGDGDGVNKSISQAPLVAISQGECVHGHGTTGGEKLGIDVEEGIVGTGHSHLRPNEVPKTIASLAWMVIVGDGLHNVTDGLAIGAAFASSIGAGLSTVLAIFFHEIPQELGDFAVLLNAGMSVKQALLWNFISACMCFVGLIIGLLLGEYTKGIILWILAFTAGGFLYIALTDMLPAMIKQLNHKDFLKRFIMQNIGIIAGFAIMVVIALNEESFAKYF